MAPSSTSRVAEPLAGHPLLEQGVVELGRGSASRRLRPGSRRGTAAPGRVDAEAAGPSGALSRDTGRLGRAARWPRGRSLLGSGLSAGRRGFTRMGQQAARGHTSAARRVLDHARAGQGVHTGSDLRHIATPWRPAHSSRAAAWRRRSISCSRRCGSRRGPTCCSTPGSAPLLRIDGRLERLERMAAPLTPADTEAMLLVLLNDKQVGRVRDAARGRLLVLLAGPGPVPGQRVPPARLCRRWRCG